MLEPKSALASALAKGGRDGADGKRHCRLGELRGWVLLQVEGFPGTIAEVERVLPAVVGTALPRARSSSVVRWSSSRPATWPFSTRSEASASSP